MTNHIKLALFTLITLLTGPLSLSAEAEKKQQHIIVGYYPNWGMYRNPSFKPADINFDLVTHINYAFAKVDTAGNIILFDPWADIEWRNDWTTEKSYWGNFREFTNLKKLHPHIKTMISVGGWTLSDTFSALADNPQARANFARSAVKFCKDYDFDGIDIDWEYPCFAEHNGRPQDTKNFTLMLAELHKAAKAQNPPLLVTIAAPAGPHHYINMEVGKIHQYLDWINLMAYDFYGPWSDNGVTNHNAPLYPSQYGDPLFCAEAAVDYYLEQKVPPKKLILGMPLYGRSYANVQSNKDGLFSTYQGPGTGTTQEVGMRFFYDIQQNLLPTYTKHWDEYAQVPYLYNASRKEFVSYDNEDSLRLKSRFVKERKLGGAMVWELGLDVRPTWNGMRTIYNELSDTE